MSQNSTPKRNGGYGDQRQSRLGEVVALAPVREGWSSPKKVDSELDGVERGTAPLSTGLATTGDVKGEQKIDPSIAKKILQPRPW